MSSLKALNVAVTKSQFGYLTGEAARQNISLSELVRRLLGEARPGFNDPVRSVRHRPSEYSFAGEE